MSKLRLIALVLAIAPTFAHAEIVYENLSNALIAWSYSGPTTREFGDKVTLAGTARELTSVAYWLKGSGGQGTLDATFRVYAVDPGTQLPGALLSQTSAAGVAYSGSPFITLVSMPTVTLPETVFVTAEVTASTTGDHGFIATTGPQSGSTDADFWYENQGGTWVQMGPVGNGWGNMGLRVNAVPEPASCAGLALGALGLLRLRRRSR